MSRKLHPVSKLAELLVERWPDYAVHQLTFAEKQISRHVKPLLDALEKCHELCEEDDDCPGCRLLAEWGAKL